MKIILTESQYNKLLADSKKKVIITESQYKKLLTEIYMTENINEIKKNNSIIINKQNNDKLFFEVIDSSDGDLLMVNTNKGSALAGSYYYIKSNGLSNGDLTYKFAYKKNVGVLTTIDPVLMDTWKESTLKDILYFYVFKDNSNKDLLFAIDVITGEKRMIDAKEFQKGEIGKNIKSSDVVKQSIYKKPNNILALFGKKAKGTLRSKEILDKWGQLNYSYDDITSDNPDNQGQTRTVEFKINSVTKIINQNEYDKFINVLVNKTSGKGKYKNYKPPVIDNTINGFYFKLMLLNKIQNPNSPLDTFRATVNTGQKGSLEVIAEITVEVNYNI